MATTTMDSTNKPQLSGPCANPQCPFGGMAPSLHKCPCCHKNIHLPCGKATVDFECVLCPICERQLEYQREAKRGRPAEQQQNYDYFPPAKKYRELCETHDGLGNAVADAETWFHRASETYSNCRADATPTPADQEPSANPWQFVTMPLTQVNQLVQELRQVKQEILDLRAEHKSSYRKLLRALKTNNGNLRTNHGCTSTDNNYAASDTAASVVVDAGGAKNIGTAECNDNDNETIEADENTTTNAANETAATDGGTSTDNNNAVSDTAAPVAVDAGDTKNIDTEKGNANDDDTIEADENSTTNAANETAATDGGTHDNTSGGATDMEQQQQVPALVADAGGTNNLGAEKGNANDDDTIEADENSTTNAANETAVTDGGTIGNASGGPFHMEQPQQVPVATPIGPDDVKYTTLLCRSPRNLYNLWKEWVTGISGRKPASQFTELERYKVKRTFSRRLVFWKVVSDMVQSGGMTAKEAIDKVYQVYGSHDICDILDQMKVDAKLPGGRHPDLVAGRLLDADAVVFFQNWFHSIQHRGVNSSGF